MPRAISPVLFLATILAIPSNLQAATYYVGNCKSGSFASISAAVNSPNVAPGSIIDVCPGSYVEQIVISKPLTLQGITAGGSNRVTIEPISPASLVTTITAVLGRTLAPNVWITATGGPVNINNITVFDFGGNTCPSPALVVGIYYASGSSGTLNHVATSQTGLLHCGVGVWAENADLAGGGSVTIKNSDIEADGYGIVAAGGPHEVGTIPLMFVTISGNEVLQSGLGMYLYAAGGSVSGNFVKTTDQLTSLGEIGISDAAPNVTISGNTLITANSGIDILSPGATITSNKIIDGGINFHCLLANVTSNTFYVQGMRSVPTSFTGTNSFYDTLTIRSGGC